MIAKRSFRVPSWHKQDWEGGNLVGIQSRAAVKARPGGSLTELLVSFLELFQRTASELIRLTLRVRAAQPCTHLAHNPFIKLHWLGEVPK
ncbi:unnamed protein product [Leptosia nina]|uniref:Uncharacterized protein n=1 Tax=Leptosia nina TaxID=320188 RepID=A0AAV1JUQ3_9NEOP